MEFVVRGRGQRQLLVIHGEHDESNSSENILATCVGRPEASCPSGEYGSVSGRGETYLNRDGGSGLERKRRMKTC